MKKQIAGMVVAVIAAAVVLGAVISTLVPVAGPADVDMRDLPDGWTQTNWPFLKDQFGAGVAFECRAPICENAVRVTIRPKIGFCNCVTGVSDDEELARIGDVDLVRPGLVARDAGREIEVGRLNGRSRLYSPAGSESALDQVRSIAFNNRCDVVVATASGAETVDGDARVMAFLRSDAILSWTDRVLRR
jgi:hypothetical protein